MGHINILYNVIINIFQKLFLIFGFFDFNPTVYTVPDGFINISIIYIIIHLFYLYNINNIIEIDRRGHRWVSYKTVGLKSKTLKINFIWCSHRAGPLGGGR